MSASSYYDNRWTAAMAQDALDADPRSRAEKIQALADRPGTAGEGAAAKAALSRVGGSGSKSAGEQKRDAKGQFASTGAVAEHHGWKKKTTTSMGGKPYMSMYTHPKIPGAELHVNDKDNEFNKKHGHEHAWSLTHPPNKEGHSHIETDGRYHNSPASLARRLKGIHEFIDKGGRF